MKLFSVPPTPPSNGLLALHVRCDATKPIAISQLAFVTCEKKETLAPITSYPVLTFHPQTDPPTHFADIWDEKIAPLLQQSWLIIYDIHYYYPLLKINYECSGRSFIFPSYCCDIKHLAMAYLSTPGNYSFATIAHTLQLSVDLDHPASCAIVCLKSLYWFTRHYPVTIKNLPRHFPTTPRPIAAKETSATTKPAYTGMIYFCTFLLIVSYYIYRHIQERPIDWQAYSLSRTIGTPPGSFQKDVIYTITPGTYIIPNEKDIEPFLTAAKENNTEKIRAMAQHKQILIFAFTAHAYILGDITHIHFIPVRILDGDYKNKVGFIPYTQLDAPPP
ncbi:hypothetical protein [uncultured Megasphaera sp.]|uniref:hypothetical protein n=1 Tax=uncultured Megasphaera sp. TaxID=165188 RepID=UPI00259A47CE|nr:hypothetical protein [uncultured Megasphaera sp.]